MPCSKISKETKVMGNLNASVNKMTKLQPKQLKLQKENVAKRIEKGKRKSS